MNDVIDLIRQGKIKRYFRTRDKYSFEGAVTHVTQHASGTEPLFLEAADYLYMLGLIKDACERFKLNLFSFCLMLNHIHLLLRLASANLPEAMKVLFQTYAEYFNKKYERKGHVFSAPYSSSLCFDDAYLLAASLYINFNPVKAKIVKDPVDYRWSSCGLFLSGKEIETFVDYKFVLNMLDNDILKASREYDHLLKQMDTVEIKDIFEHPRALDLLADILKERGLYTKDDLDKKIEALKEKGRLMKPKDLYAREFLIKQLKARDYSIPEISGKLGVSRCTVYKTLKLTNLTLSELST